MLLFCLTKFIKNDNIRFAVGCKLYVEGNESIVENKKFTNLKSALETCYLDMNNAEKEIVLAKLIHEARNSGIELFELEFENLNKNSKVRYILELDRCAVRALEKIQICSEPYCNYVECIGSIFKSRDYDIRNLYASESYYDEMISNGVKKEISLVVDEKSQIFIEEVYHYLGKKKYNFEKSCSMNEVYERYKNSCIAPMLKDDNMFNEVEFLYSVLNKNCNLKVDDSKQLRKAM